VVQKGGALAGYRWGLPRKVALLDAEAQHAQHVCADDAGTASISTLATKLDHAA
jgi:AraC family transcriptional regulator of adaptative response/methylated-DNA-[protein]-cysteine methyltransferase